jgi:hypothetical protein
MVKITEGGPIIVTPQEREVEIKSIVLETIKQVQSTMIFNSPGRRTLDIEGVMLLFKKKSRSTIDAYRRRKKNPLPMFGNPPLIEEDIALEWYKKHSGEYQEE